MVRQTLALALVLLVLSVACDGNDDSSGSPAPAATSSPGGPAISLEPAGGPPNTLITVRGNGWPSGLQVSIFGAADTDRPYATATVSDRGDFSVQFRLAQLPDGSPLVTGSFDVTARATGVQASAPFQVEPPRPAQTPGSSGG